MKDKNQKYLFSIFSILLIVFVFLIFKNILISNQEARVSSVNNVSYSNSDNYIDTKDIKPSNLVNNNQSNQDSETFMDIDLDDTFSLPNQMNNLSQTNTNLTNSNLKPITHNLYKGNPFNNKDEVIYLQRFLITSGFLDNGNDTGFFGTLTEKAVIDLQKANNIFPSYGYVGPVTRNLINDQLSSGNFSIDGLSSGLPPGSNLKPPVGNYKCPSCGSGGKCCLEYNSNTASPLGSGGYCWGYTGNIIYSGMCSF